MHRLHRHKTAVLHLNLWKLPHGRYIFRKMSPGVNFEVFWCKVKKTLSEQASWIFLKNYLGMEAIGYRFDIWIFHLKLNKCLKCTNLCTELGRYRVRIKKGKKFTSHSDTMLEPISSPLIHNAEKHVPVTPYGILKCFGAKGQENISHRKLTWLFLLSKIKINAPKKLYQLKCRNQNFHRCHSCDMGSHRKQSKYASFTAVSTTLTNKIPYITQICIFTLQKITI